MSTLSSQPVGAIVDGYSTGNFLPAAFRALDVQVVHVQSTAELMPSMLAPDLAQYSDNVVFDGPDAIAKLADRDLAFVIAGQEPGVPLADQLSETLGLATNGSALSSARRNKFDMIEVLRAVGLRCALQFKSDKPAELADWAERNGAVPAVVKPLSSASTDGVFICRTREEIIEAAEWVLAAKDIFDIRNTEVLIQSYLDGPEFIVDTVSCDGERFVCGVWQYDKSLLPNGKKIYDKDILLAADAAPVPELIAYIDQVLDALNIRWGAAHAEVILTADGPALVEIGARLNGNMNPGFHDVCLGQNQADLIALAYVRPDEFKARYGGRVYQRRQPAVVYNTPTTLDGTVDAIDEAVVAKISELDSVHLLSVKIKPGGRIRATVDLLTSPLRVFMTAPAQDQIMTDYEAIRELKDKVYRTR